MGIEAVEDIIADLDQALDNTDANVRVRHHRGAWVVWMLPFVLSKRPAASAASGPSRTLGHFADGTFIRGALAIPVLADLPSGLAFGAGDCFPAVADVLSWTATRVLGKQWRVDAGLNAEHELITAGPYRIVRHPIYTSVLCMLWGTGFILLPLYLILIATIPALIGTEIRVRIEDGLLAARFGEQFDQYQRSVSAYIPFVR